MTTKRIHTTTSRTAEMNCLYRAPSSLEADAHYHSDDDLAQRLLPDLFRAFLHVSLFRVFLIHALPPPGVYEYVIARTKYIDAVFRQALAEQFEQVLLFGAGFDTRALRFQSQAQHARFFELDAPLTQQAKIRQYHHRGLVVPSNLVFIPIDFDKESLPDKLDTAGFQRDRKSLFVLEGVLMYLQAESVQASLQTIRDYAGTGSRVVFDYVQASGAATGEYALR